LLLPPPSGIAAPLIVVSIGANSGLPTEAPLKHAESDAQKVARTLQSLGAVSKEDLRVLVGTSPSEVTEAMAWASRRATAREGARVLVYFSGHGDEAHLHIGDERLSLVAIEQALAVVPADLRLLVIDACRSRDGRDKGLVAAPTFAVSLNEPPGPTGAVVLRSASDGEAAQESDALSGGVFTHYLVSGLLGAADANGDERVTLDEVYAYAYDRTLQRSAASAGTVQRPTVKSQLSGAGPVVLTHTSKSSAALLFPAEADVQYLVFRLPSQTLVAEAWSSPDGTRRVALPAGRFLVQRRTATTVQRAELMLPYGGSKELADNDFTDAEAITVASRGAMAAPELVVRHEVGASYGAVGAVEVGLGHRLRARYALRLDPAWSVAVGGELGLSRWQSETSDVDEQWAGGELRAEWRREWSPVLLRVSAGAVILGLWRDRTALESARLEGAGLAAESSSRALASGPTVAISSSIALGRGFWLDLGLSGAAWFYQENSATQTRLLASLDAGISFEF
jgi:hypothetical protein